MLYFYTQCCAQAPAQQPQSGTVSSACSELAKKVSAAFSSCVPVFTSYSQSVQRELRACCLQAYANRNAFRNALAIEAPMAMRD